MRYVRVTVQMTNEEVAQIDKAAEELASTTGQRRTRSAIVREGAKRYAKELLGGPLSARGRTKPATAHQTKGPTKIRARYKGRFYRATFRRDGAISFAGKRYSSPSLAAQAICGHACNGWAFWQYETTPGDWVSLRHLRD
jgi:hypothetical protein